MNELLKDELLKIKDLELGDKVRVINEVKEIIKSISPFTKEPVELLHTSIKEDGYTQPIVVWQHDDYYEVVDGFHRNRVGKECEDIKERIHGYLPVVVINDEVTDRGQRIASTVRHNRARGKHQVEAMSDIVLELRRRNWSNEKIAKKLGMDADEVLRLAQITGLAEMFKDREFSEAWEIDKDEEYNNIIIED